MTGRGGGKVRGGRRERERGEVGWRSGSQRDLRERRESEEKTKRGDRVPAGELKVETHLEETIVEDSRSSS